MLKPLASLLVLALLAVGAAQALAAPRSVKVGDDYFVRKGSAPTVTVHKGAKVVWRNTGSTHNIVVTRGPATFRSSYLSRGQTFSKRLRRTGTYRIVCTIHSGMKMTLKVIR